MSGIPFTGIKAYLKLDGDKYDGLIIKTFQHGRVTRQSIINRKKYKHPVARIGYDMGVASISNVIFDKEVDVYLDKIMQVD